MREKPLRVGRETVRNLLKENIKDVQICNDFLDYYTAYLKVLLRARLEMLVRRHSERLERALDEENHAKGNQRMRTGKRITTEIADEVFEVEWRENEGDERE